MAHIKFKILPSKRLLPYGIWPGSMAGASLREGKGLKLESLWKARLFSFSKSVLSFVALLYGLFRSLQRLGCSSRDQGQDFHGAVALGGCDILGTRFLSGPNLGFSLKGF